MVENAFFVKNRIVRIRKKSNRFKETLRNLGRIVKKFAVWRDKIVKNVNRTPLNRHPVSCGWKVKFVVVVFVEIFPFEGGKFRIFLMSWGLL